MVPSPKEVKQYKKGQPEPATHSLGMHEGTQLWRMAAPFSPQLGFKRSTAIVQYSKTVGRTFIMALTALFFNVFMRAKVKTCTDFVRLLSDLFWSLLMVIRLFLTDVLPMVYRWLIGSKYLKFP